MFDNYKMSWPLYEEVNQGNGNKFNVYRCLDPVAVVTGSPWFYGLGENVCPCDPNLSNNTGRGFTACPLGINQEATSWNLPSSQLSSQIPNQNQIVGSMFNKNQFVPPQLQPRQLVRIGEEWRSAN
jgi:hypothetical protein